MKYRLEIQRCPNNYYTEEYQKTLPPFGDLELALPATILPLAYRKLILIFRIRKIIEKQKSTSMIDEKTGHP